MSRFLDALHSGRVLLMDGAMGTELQRAGVGEGECYEAWNLTHEEQVWAIHQAYAGAGAEVLLTNTFQANPASLARHRLEGQMVGIHRAGYALARAAAGPDRFVLTDVGPLVARPGGAEFADLASLRQVALCASAADAVLLETCSSPRVRFAVQAARAHGGGLPVLLSLTFLRNESGKLTTASGHPPEWFARRARGYGVAALGVNCGRDLGMDEVIEIVRRYHSATDLPVFARPNAGTPSRKGDRWAYPLTPETMAARLPDLLEAGVSMVGGCCGTTPSHVAALGPIIDTWNANRGD